MSFLPLGSLSSCGGSKPGDPRSSFRADTPSIAVSGGPQYQGLHEEPAEEEHVSDLAESVQSEGQIAPAEEARAGQDWEPQLEGFRTELRGYCYRMLGSAFEADDAVQETMIRAWKSLDRFEGRSSLRSWLYRIATNVCFDSSSAQQRRARPMDLAPAGNADSPLPSRRPEVAWLEPIPDSSVLPANVDPGELTVMRETIRLAFVSALQHLPPQQRAVLILREVVHWKADEVAELLETTTASVNSALQRARATMETKQSAEPASLKDEKQDFLDRYVDAFERYDMDALVSLLHEDVILSMPPYDLWMCGRDNFRNWLLGTGKGCRGSRLVPTWANGSPAFAQYRRGESGGTYVAWALQVLEMEDGKVIGFNAFLDTERIFPLFGLPLTLEP